MKTETASSDLASLLRQWRLARRMSQLDLSLAAGTSQRHLSFVESGRARPSREMVTMLAEALALPLREHNRLLLAAGFAPRFEERRLDDLTFAPALEAVQRLLAAHEPNPAVAVDRHWNLVYANRAVGMWLAQVKDASLLAPAVNVLRLALHPGGLAPLILNFGEWRSHLLHRLRQQVEASADPGLAELERELVALPVQNAAGAPHRDGCDARARGTAARAHRRAHALLHECDHRLRHASRRHPVGARHRDVPAGRRGDGSLAAGDGGQTMMPKSGNRLSGNIMVQLVDPAACMRCDVVPLSCNRP